LPSGGHSGSENYLTDIVAGPAGEGGRPVRKTRGKRKKTKAAPRKKPDPA